MEIKHKVSFSNKLCSLWDNDDIYWCECFTRTGFGGIIVVWDIHMFLDSNRVINDRWILVEGNIAQRNFKCFIGGSI